MTVTGNLYLDVVAIALKEGVRVDANSNVQIAGGCAMRTGIALSRHPQAGTALYSRGDTNFDSVLP